MQLLAETPQNHTTARRITTDYVLWFALLLCGTMLAWLGIARYAGYNVGMLDIGNMSQAIASVGRGHPLVYTQSDGPLSRLSVHLELFYLLLAPLYALWPDPRALIALQATAFVFGALPAYTLALRRTNSRFIARCITLIYLFYPVAQTAVLFDIHGDTFALPLLMFALEALDSQRWKRYALWLALALSCKFYVAVPVAVLGFVLWRDDQPRVGLVTFLAAVLYGLIAFLGLRALFTTPETAIDQSGLNYINFYFGNFTDIWNTLNDRILSAIVVFVPALFVAWRGWRWVLPGLPIAAAALLSTGPGGSYDYRYHHYAIVVPFIVMATIDGVTQMQQAAVHRTTRRGRSWRGDLGLTLAIVLIFNVSLVDTPLNPLFWLGVPGEGRDPSVYGVIPRDAVKDQFLQLVPAGVPVAASNQLAAHLTNRDTLYLLRYPDEADGPARLPNTLTKVDDVVSDALFDYYVPLDGGYGGGLDGDQPALNIILRDHTFGLTAMRDGLLLFQRNAPAQNVLTNTVALLSDDGTPAEHMFGAQIALINHSLTSLGPRRLRTQFTWRLTGSFERVGRFVAVSHLEGVPNARFVHLPTYALQPSWSWPQHQLIQETFDIELPTDLAPGTYTWRTGWYNVALPSSYATDVRSLLAGSAEVNIDKVNIGASTAIVFHNHIKPR